MQFAVDIGLTHAAGDELGVLGAEIENEYFLMHFVRVQDSGIRIQGKRRTKD